MTSVVSNRLKTLSSTRLAIFCVWGPSQRFMPVVAIPSISRRWKNRKMKNTGSRERQDMANNPTQSEIEVESTNERKPSCTVYDLTSLRKTSGPKKSVQVQMKEKIAAVARTGTDNGRMIMK